MHGERILGAVGGSRRERRHHDFVNDTGDPGIETGGRNARLRADLSDDLLRRLPPKQMSAGQKLPQHDADAEKVDSRVEGLVAEELRRHVWQLASRKFVARVDTASDAEVADFDPAFVAHQNVFWTDVPMHDRHRLAGLVDVPVRVCEAGEHFARDMRGQPNRKSVRADPHRP